MDRTEMSKSLEIKVPHFQKDVIIPQIYDLKNIKLIQNFGYKDSPVNKVLELKKKKIQNVIKGIVYKNKVEPTRTEPLYKSLSLQKQSKEGKKSQPYYSNMMESIKIDGLFMEIDEELGQMIALADQTFLPFADRVKSALEKSKHHAKDQDLLRKTQEANFFMKSICQNSSKKVNPEKVRPISGLLEQLDQMQKKRKQNPGRRRAQSATVVRSKSAVKHSPQLYKLGQMSRSSRNLKEKHSLETELNRSKEIIKTINTCLEEQSKIKKWTKVKMTEMKDEWDKDGQLLKTFIRSSNAVLNPSALNILKEKRLKVQALARIDKEYFKK